MSLKGSTTQNTKQTSDPPKWAKPLFEKVAGDALGMYNRGEGYNVYRGPTQANFSPQKLQALNKAMTMTGGGPAITNEGIFNNPQIQQVRDMVAAQQIAEQQKKAAAVASAAQQSTSSGGKWINVRGPDGVWTKQFVQPKDRRLVG